MDEKEVKGYIAKPKEGTNIIEMLPANYSKLKEAYKSKTEDEEVKIPKDLGAEHPFELSQVDKTLSNVGIVNAMVDKVVDSIIGDFQIEVESSSKGTENAQVLVDELMENSDFLTHIRPWIKEGISKGNGYMDLSNIEEQKIITINASQMYVRRDKHSKVLSYNQYLGSKNKVQINKDNTITFKPTEVAHLKINAIPGQPYGLGYLWPNMKAVDHYAGIEVDRHKLISRKAGAPIHARVGIAGESTQTEDIDSFSNDLQYMNNRTEWVTDANVEMKILDFGDVGKTLTEASKHDIQQIAMGMRIPMTLLGVEGVPEGLSKAQSEDYLRFIASVRIIIEDVIEENIIRPYLRRLGYDSTVNFLWEMQGEEQKEKRLQTIQQAMSSPIISPELRASLEREYAKVLGLEELEDLLPTPQEARKRADEEMRKREEDIKQPEVPGAKPTANQKAKVLKSEDNNKDEVIKNRTGGTSVHEAAKDHKHAKNGECLEQEDAPVLSEEQLINMPVSEYVNITEIPGFNYTDYLVKILRNLQTETFEELKALTEQDLILGKLPGKELKKLKAILKEGFQKNKTIREIEKDITNTMEIPDRKMEKDGDLVITAKAEKRPNMIARTETVRLANAGLKDLYEENEIKQYRYLAAVDERTSNTCLSLNGQIFNVKDGMPGVNMPPMHANCRSTIVGVVE